jgi:hypothetical protein
MESGNRIGKGWGECGRGKGIGKWGRGEDGEGICEYRKIVAAGKAADRFWREQKAGENNGG